MQWNFKISDIGGKQHGKLPFDGFAIYKNKPLYWEAKFLPKPQSFNWARLEDHQLENLLYIQKNCPSALTWIIIGVCYGRGKNRAYIFDNLDEVKRRKEGKINILKKEFDCLPYYPIKKGKIDFDNLITP